MRIAFSIAVIGAVFVLAGCGTGHPKTAPVRGTVTFKGKAVPNGTIMFVPSSGAAATGEIQPDGSFTLTTYDKGDGAVPAQYTVVIVAREDTSTRLPEDRNPLPPSIVPNRFTSAATSPLKAEVKDKENVFEFPLD